MTAIPFRFLTFKNEITSAAQVEDALVVIAIPLIWWHCLFFFGSTYTRTVCWSIVCFSADGQTGKTKKI